MPKIVVMDDSGNWIGDTYVADAFVDDLRASTNVVTGSNVGEVLLARSLEIANVRRDKDTLQTEVNALKRKWTSHVEALTEAVMEHEGCSGCIDGKRDFLENLGLSLPEKKFYISVSFKVNPDHWDYSESDLADSVVSVLDGYCDVVEDSSTECDSYEIQNV